MIQDIAPRVFHGEYRNREPEAQSRIFCFRGEQVLLTRLRRAAPRSLYSERNVILHTAIRQENVRDVRADDKDDQPDHRQRPKQYFF